MFKKTLITLLAALLALSPALAAAQSDDAEGPPPQTRQAQSSPGAAFDRTEEMALGWGADREIMSRSVLMVSEPLTSKLTQITNRLAAVSEHPFQKYQVLVLNDPTINAMASGGGRIYIYSGLLDVLQSEAELAAVIGHEIRHTNARHLKLAQDNAQASKVVGQVAAILLGTALAVMGARLAPSTKGDYGLPTPAQSMSQLGLNIGSGIGQAMLRSMVLGYGRELELDADAASVRYLHKAGYDPRAMISMLGKLKTVRDRLRITRGNYTSSLINAEPGLDARMEQAQAVISGRPAPATSPAAQE